MSNVWMTSDLHFGHNRDFIWSPRGFSSVWEHDKTIIQNWNSVVQPEDEIYVLGDLMLNDNEHGLSCIKQLKGNIHVIRGNHDSDTRMQLYNDCYNIIEITEGQFFRYGKYHFYLSHFPCLTANGDIDKPLKARIVNICGHVHSKDPFCDWDKGIIFHCEIDTKPDCSPWLLDDIINKIKEKL